jgi:CheY-like chemotaxis protein
MACALLKHEGMSGTALICIDDPALTASLAGRLKGRGWECVTDDTLVGTLGLAARLIPDLIFLDARADQVLRALKADPRTTRASVVMVTDSGGWDRRERCLQAGALAFTGRTAGGDVLDALAAFVEHGRSGSVEVPASSPSRPAPAAHV